MNSNYERTFTYEGNEIRAVMQGNTAAVYYNGLKMAEKFQQPPAMAVLVFTAFEHGQQVTYDVAFLFTTFIRIFIGRNGSLIFTDDPAFSRRKLG